MGQEAGSILWESKRAESFSAAWVQKLKDDQRTNTAILAGIVTTAMPKGITDPFCFHEGIWVVSVGALRPVAEVLRTIVLEGTRQKAVGEAKDEKKSAVFDYLCGSAFAQKIRAAVDSAVAIKRELEGERSAMTRIWKHREKQADRIVQSMMEMCGELQGIARESLPELTEIGQLPASPEDISLEEVLNPTATKVER
jgi:hypothetical protein